MSENIVNLAFYKFVEIDDANAFGELIRQKTAEFGMQGSFLVAPEGINSMLAGTESQCEGFIDWLTSDPRFEDLWVKRSYSDRVPFKRMTIKVKPEIVVMRVDGVDAIHQTGNSLPPDAFRDLLRSDEEIVLIDCRNDFEWELGTFAGAVNPETTAFSQFPDYVRDHRSEWNDRKVVMFCTGGIRCEKATSWMMDEGIHEVYQLEGGILNYFEQIEDADTDWKGELFVFDQRVALDTNLNETDTELDASTGRGFIRPGMEQPAS